MPINCCRIPIFATCQEQFLMNDGPEQDYNRALDAFHGVVHAAYQTWIDTRDEPWPGWGNMTPQQLTDLGIPELPTPPEPGPAAPHADPRDPGFVLNRWLHPSMYTAVPDPSWPLDYEEEAHAKLEAQHAVLRDARDALHGGREPHRPAGEDQIDLDTEEGLAAYIAEHEREHEAGERAHQDYMKYLEHLAELRGQTLDQYLALQEAEPEDPEAGA
jgi:hypothetical protein